MGDTKTDRPQDKAGIFLIPPLTVEFQEKTTTTTPPSAIYRSYE